ncbi:MAG: hypothetical protein ABSE17_03295 [Candidatus Levyibacteriota bacterium]|jgi:hypothetical protein
MAEGKGDVVNPFLVGEGGIALRKRLLGEDADVEAPKTPVEKPSSPETHPASELLVEKSLGTSPVPGMSPKELARRARERQDRTLDQDLAKIREPNLIQKVIGGAIRSFQERRKLIKTVGTTPSAEFTTIPPLVETAKPAETEGEVQVKFSINPEPEVPDEQITPVKPRIAQPPVETSATGEKPTKPARKRKPPTETAVKLATADRGLRLPGNKTETPEQSAARISQTANNAVANLQRAVRGKSSSSTQ